MATPKQIKYIQFACGRLGRRVLSSEDIQALSREEIDNLIKELKAADPRNNSNNSASSYNGDNVRRNTTDAILGMCFKLYVKNAGVSTAVVNESETHRVVETLYHIYKRICAKVKFAEEVNGEQGSNNKFAARH